MNDLKKKKEKKKQGAMEVMKSMHVSVPSALHREDTMPSRAEGTRWGAQQEPRQRSNAAPSGIPTFTYRST